MSRFFIETSNIFSDIINITGDDVNHIKKVLRSRPGDIITLCDSKGNDYIVNIDSIKPDLVETKIVEIKKSITEPPVDIILFQGLPKSDKMDFIIQKSVELGIKKIVPVVTERTVVKIDSKKDSANKTARWQRISLEAAKQCNRGVVPEVSEPVGFMQALQLCSRSDLSLIPYERERSKGLRSLITADGIKTISVIIGPEGGFTAEEVDIAEQAGIKPVSLGPRILRTETAGIAVLAILMYQFGDAGLPG